jgi:hypothetical protein
VRRGAASCRAVLGSCPVAAAVRDAGQVPSPRSIRGWPNAPRRRTWARSGRPGGVAGRKGCPDAGRAGRCLSARPVRRGDVRPTGRADVQHPGVRCPGVRGIQVSGRTGSGVRGAAAALSAPRWTPEWLSGGPPGRAQRVDVPPWSVGGGGRLPASGRMGRGWCGVGRGWLARGSTVARAAAWLAFRLRRRLGLGGPTRAGPGPGCRPGGGGAWDAEGASPVPPQGVGAVAGVVPDHGLGPRGGDHAEWSLGLGWSGGVQLRRAHPVRWGAACGRSAAAVGEERCPLGTRRALTSENSGGRDRHSTCDPFRVSKPPGTAVPKAVLAGRAQP